MCFILEEPGFHYSGVLPLVFAEGGETGGMAEGGVQEEGSSHFVPWFSVFLTQTRAPHCCYTSTNKLMKHLLILH